MGVRASGPEGPEETPAQAPEAAPAPVPPPGPVPPAPVTEEKRPSRGGMLFGVLLVAAGVLFLAGRFVPWLRIADAWPLIIVALGVIQAVRAKDLFGVLDGATTVVIGGILLANTTGRLSWGVWGSILSLWPLLLVSAGIALIAQAMSQRWLRAVAQLVIIAGLLYGALAAPSPSWGFVPFTPTLSAGEMATFGEEVTQGSAEATLTTGAATVRWGAGELDIGDGARIAAISGRAPDNLLPALEARKSDGRVELDIGNERSSGAGADSRLEIELGRDIVWEDVRLNTGASSGKIDLSRLIVERLEMNTGASSTTLVLGEDGPETVNVNMGVANLVLRVPESAGVTLDVQGLVATSLPSGFDRVRGGPLDGSWKGGPADAPVQIRILVKGGIANIDVETY